MAEQRVDVQAVVIEVARLPLGPGDAVLLCPREGELSDEVATALMRGLDGMLPDHPILVSGVPLDATVVPSGEVPSV